MCLLILVLNYKKLPDEFSQLLTRLAHLKSLTAASDQVLPSKGYQLLVISIFHVNRFKGSYLVGELKLSDGSCFIK